MVVWSVIITLLSLPLVLKLTWFKADDGIADDGTLYKTLLPISLKERLLFPKFKN